MLKFIGRGSAFTDNNNCAVFTYGNDLILLDCPATAYQKLKHTNLLGYDDIYVLVTHTHGDHINGIDTLLQYIWFKSKMQKRITIVAPSPVVEYDLWKILKLKGCSKKWYKITSADEFKKSWFLNAIKTEHADELKNRCFGYRLLIKGKTVIYTGDTRSLDAFRPYVKRGAYLYTDASCFRTSVHLFLPDALEELRSMTEKGAHVYAMHMDDEATIKEMIAGTKIKMATICKKLPDPGKE